jgi:hypothetical protein
VGDEAKFIVTLQGDDNLQLVVRAHLRAEQLLFKIITAGLQEPGVLDLDRMTFLNEVRVGALFEVLDDFDVADGGDPDVGADSELGNSNLCRALYIVSV